jgi:hypothetical protein
MGNSRMDAWDRDRELAEGLDHNGTDPLWKEYDSAADYYGRFGHLPDGLSGRVGKEIENHPEDFESRVKDIKYSRAMKALDQ